jgi:hypothetical protein
MILPTIKSEVMAQLRWSWTASRRQFRPSPSVQRSISDALHLNGQTIPSRLKRVFNLEAPATP